MKIAFFDTKPYDRKSFDEALAGRSGIEIQYYETKLGPASAKLAEGADAVCAFVNDDLGEATIRELVRCGVRLIAMRCAGYNNVCLPEAYGKIAVARVPEYSPYAVAEYALGLLLTLNRNIHRAYCRVREGNFSIAGLSGMDLHGKTLGIIGTGKIGMRFAAVAQGLGMRMIAFDMFPNPEKAKPLGLEYVDLDRLLRESDVVSLHCPLTPENRHMIGAETIPKMKNGVIIVNTSRGALIDTAALIAGLKSKKIGGAGLDVYEEETDYFFEDLSESGIQDDALARLTTFPNVIVSSHQAFFTKEALRNIASVTLDNVEAFAAGRALTNEICKNCDGSRRCRKKCPKSAS